MIDGGEWPSLGPAAFSGVLLLGAYHGINPAMGWLFAVALGMQDRSSRGVWRSLPPIAIGHGAAIGLALVALGMIQVVVPLPAVRIVVALVLCGMGVYRVVRQRHPSWGGMQVGFRDLVFWSFLMASAHGAGLMVLPLVMTGGESGSTLGAEPCRCSCNETGAPEIIVRQLGPGAARTAQSVETVRVTLGFNADATRLCCHFAGAHGSPPPPMAAMRAHRARKTVMARAAICW